MVPITPDRYRFVDVRVDVRTSHVEMRSHLRGVHARFLLPPDGESPADLTLEITHRAADDTWLLQDERYRYRCGADGSVTWSDHDSGLLAPPGRSDPFTVAQCAMIHGAATMTAGHVVHASAVSHAGRGLIFPSMSRGGKTTLALRLALEGWRFLSDEIAWIGADGRTLEPFPRRVNLRRGSAELLGLAHRSCAAGRPAADDSESIDIEALVPGSLGPRCPLDTIVFLDGFAEEPRLRRIARVDAAVELARNLVLPLVDAPSTLLTCAGIVEPVDCFRLTAGPPDATAALLAALAARERDAMARAG